MSTLDIYQTELWADGMQVDFTKLNNMERFVRAAITDQVLQTLVGGIANSGITMPEFGGQNGANPPSIWAYALSPGAAYLRQGSANNKIQIAPGTLIQKIANSDGMGATFAPYTFAGTEEFTLTNGDATNPRVDLLQMQLQYVSSSPASVDFQDAVSRAITSTPSTNTKRQLQCTMSVKVGTPATSPRIPDPDTGFVAVGTVVVGNGWTTGGSAPIFGIDTVATNNAVVHDQRMPISVTPYTTPPSQFLLQSGWALSNNNSTVTSSSSTNNLNAVIGGGSGRIIGIDVVTGGLTLSTAPTIGAFHYDFLGLSSSYVRNNSLSTSIVTAVARATRSQVETAHFPNGGAGPTILPSTTLAIGVPTWTSGYRTPQPPTGGLSAWSSVNVTNLPTTTTIGPITFYVARGL